MSWRVELSRSAERDFGRLGAQTRQRIQPRLDALANDPRPIGSRKLAGVELYRIRAGDYRIVYELLESELVVLVVRVAHRSAAYRRS